MPTMAHLTTMYRFSATHSHKLPLPSHTLHKHRHVLHSRVIICRFVSTIEAMRFTQQKALGFYQGRFVDVQFKNHTLTGVLTGDYATINHAVSTTASVPIKAAILLTYWFK